MADYRAPLKDMQFAIEELAGLSQLNSLDAFSEATPDLIETVLAQAGELAAMVIAPANRVGDQEGTRVEDGAVVVPKAFTSAYRQFVEDGWPSLVHDPEFGGQGLPHVVGMAVEELWTSANMAWSLCTMLSQSAVRAVKHHGTAELQAQYLEKLVSGEWTGTMNLTEPQAGSDLAALTCQATPDGDAYRVSGQKIFITWGDHPMTDNIVHLVLARLPDAPEGVRGISLFLVPKFLLDADGSPAEPNSVGPVSVEHKLGIHGSPTCVMEFNDAKGYLVGDENRGLACMFTMMNLARIAVGVEGLSIAERAYQDARQYAQERVQGTLPGHEGRVTIIHHPDVRRMLMQMKAYVEAMRGVCYTTAASMDLATHAATDEERALHQTRLDLMTPITKGWCTEIGQWLTSLAVQVHGGMGFVEETGVAQHYRDSRITTIYEGTSGIQANDLIGRKTLRDSGTELGRLLDEIESLDSALKEAELDAIREPLAQAVASARAATAHVIEHAGENVHLAGAAAFDFMMLLGTTCGGAQLARGALAAHRRLQATDRDAEYLRAKIVTATFYAQDALPLVPAYCARILADTDPLMALTEDQF